MHGLEHHFLVPAALLAAWYNRHNNVHLKDAAIIIARHRAEYVAGGFLGFHGACGEAFGSGIFSASLLARRRLRKKNDG